MHDPFPSCPLWAAMYHRQPAIRLCLRDIFGTFCPGNSFPTMTLRQTQPLSSNLVSARYVRGLAHLKPPDKVSMLISLGLAMTLRWSSFAQPSLPFLPGVPAFCRHTAAGRPWFAHHLCYSFPHPQRLCRSRDPTLSHIHLF